MFTIYYKFVLQEMRQKSTFLLKKEGKKDKHLTAVSYSIKSKGFLK